jgi:hypothetical protein
VGAVLILVVVVAVLGYLAAVALGLVGGAKKTVDEADRAGGKGAGQGRRGPGFFGWRH